MLGPAEPLAEYTTLKVLSAFTLSPAAMLHFSAFSILASERCGLVIEPLNISERALYFSDSSPKF